MFDSTSRYASLPLKTFVTRDGRMVSYVSRRFLPQPDQFDLLLTVTVTEGDRLDNITYQNLNADPTQYWRIADANGCMSPFELTEQPGSKIRITLPQGIPGPSRGAVTSANPLLALITPQGTPGRNQGGM